MTKKKGFFSKIKSKLSKDDSDHDDYEESDTGEYVFVDEDGNPVAADEIDYDEETLEDEEYEEVYEDEEDELIEAQVANTNMQDEHDIAPPPLPLSEDEEDHVDEVEDKTLEIYIDDLAEDEEKVGLLGKIKSKFSKPDELNEDEDTDNIDDEDVEEEKPLATRFNVMQNMLNKIKNKDNLKLPKSKRINSTNNLGPSLTSLLSSGSRGTIHNYFLILLVSVFFYQTGKFLGILLTGKDTTANVQSTFSKPRLYPYGEAVSNIRNYNPFNIQEDENEKTQVVEKKTKPEVKVCLESDKKSTLGIKLINTIVLQNPTKSVASISQRGKITNIRSGGKISSIAEVGSITRQRMVFKNLRTGECEYIDNVDKKAIRFAKKTKTKIHSPSKAKELMTNFNKDIKVEGNNFTIKKKLRDDLLSNIGDVLTQAKAITIKNPDGSLCFKMTEVQAGSIYSHLNVQNNDVICEINGSKINNINQIMGMFGKIKSTDQYELGIKRDGVQQSYNYNFTD